MLWDETAKVLFTFADKPLTCVDGSSANGSLMVATWGNGNQMNRPAGSGWWMASLDKGECKAHTSEAYGCKFDATGKNTSCGVAKLNEKTNDLTIVSATTTSLQ
jgi:hypothetical protein